MMMKITDNNTWIIRTIGTLKGIIKRDKDKNRESNTNSAISFKNKLIILIDKHLSYYLRRIDLNNYGYLSGI